LRDYKRLKVWPKAHSLALDVYRATEPFPRSERFGLTSQIRRAAVSVSSNIAEGCGRRTEADFARFLDQAAGSTHELSAQLLPAKDLGYLDLADFARLAAQADEVGRMLNSLLDRIRVGPTLPRVPRPEANG
jgi:four helix bundle protein